MGIFDKSSSPLSTLRPWESSFKLPDYSNAFKMNNQTQMNNLNFKTGLLTSNSSNIQTKLNGQNLVKESSINPVQEEEDSKKEPFFNTQSLAAIGAASDLVGSFLPQKSEYEGDKGYITQTADSLYNGIADKVSALGPVGQLASTIMKGGALLGKGMNALGGGTSGMTTTDALLGSSFLNLTPLGLVNGFGGKHTDTITRDDEAFAQVGGSYTGSESTVNDALQKSGKKYGLLSGGARNRANSEIWEARRQQDIISDISQDMQDRVNIRTSMSAINGNRRRFLMNGGYDQSAIRVGRNGMQLRIKNIIKAQQGKKLSPFSYFISTLPKNLQDTSDYRMEDYWNYNGQPKDFQEALDKNMFSLQKDGYHANSVAENPETGEIEYMKSENHPTRYMESDWYEKGLIYNDDGSTTQLQPGMDGYEDWKNFTSNYELQKTSPYWKYVKRTTPVKQEISKHQNGGTIIELVQESIIELINLEDIPEFQNGGTINVIPDGALHARKHNMDMKGITEKGIPVISIKEGEKPEQQAEIEKEELIFRLEVTQKLEELEKKYYSEDSSQKEKDEYALEAGKLITEEILHNTKDNAGIL